MTDRERELCKKPVSQPSLNTNPGYEGWWQRVCRRDEGHGGECSLVFSQWERCEEPSDYECGRDKATVGRR